MFLSQSHDRIPGHRRRVNIFSFETLLQIPHVLLHVLRGLLNQVLKLSVTTLVRDSGQQIQGIFLNRVQLRHVVPESIFERVVLRHVDPSYPGDQCPSTCSIHAITRYRALSRISPLCVEYDSTPPLTPSPSASRKESPWSLRARSRSRSR